MKTTPQRLSASICAGLTSISLALCALSAPLPAAAPPATTPSHAGASADAAAPPTPRVLFTDLFEAVQSAQIFPDSKTFADAVAKAPPAQVVASFRAARPLTPSDLKTFVDNNFVLPAPVAGAAPVAAPGAGAGAAPPAERAGIAQHIDSLWDTLTRSSSTAPPYSSLLTVPEPYVVPGGRFREMYYWDSYFTMLGLARSGRPDLVEHMVRDFAYLVDTYGHIPNGTRSYYLSRSQPPFFFAMVALLNADDNAAGYVRYLPELRREYRFWMQGEAHLKRGAAHRRVVAMPDGAILNRYWDDADTPREESFREDTELARKSGRVPQQLYRDVRAAAESGWDFSTRWFADGQNLASIVTTEIVPVDLNSLLFGLENAIRSGCESAHDAPCAAQFARRAAARRSAMNRYLWNAADGAYYDYRFTKRQPVPRISAATLYPLFVGAADQPQAEAVARTVALRLLKTGGVVTTPVLSGQQWDAPNGWAPLQWIGIAGLRRYSIAPLADSIACRWMLNVNRVYDETGKLVEKYDVTATGRAGGGGEYPTQDGFGWTNGVMRELMALYPQYAGQHEGPAAKPCEAAAP